MDRLVTVDPSLAGILLSLAAACLWATSNIGAAIVGRRIGPIHGLLGWQVVAVVVTGAFLLGGATPPMERWPELIVPAIAGIAAFATYFGLFAAFRLGPVTVVSPVIAVNGGLTVLLAVILLGEGLHLSQGIGAVLATAGVSLTALVWDRAAGRTRVAGPGVMWAVVSMVGFAAMNILYAQPIRDLGWVPVLFVSRLVCLVLVGLLLAARRGADLAPAPAARSVPATDLTGTLEPLAATPRLLAAIERSRPGPLLVIGGLSSMLGFVLYGAALLIAPVWLVGLASSLSPVVVVVAGIFLFGERPSRVQWAGMGLVLASIALIAAT